MRPPIVAIKQMKYKYSELFFIKVFIRLRLTGLEILTAKHAKKAQSTQRISFAIFAKL
jgi:hypothetical protein